MSINRWMDKKKDVLLYTMEHSSHKKNEIMAYAATWMGLEVHPSY